MADRAIHRGGHPEQLRADPLPKRCRSGERGHHRPHAASRTQGVPHEHNPPARGPDRRCRRRRGRGPRLRRPGPQRNRSRHVLNAATGLLTAATVASVGIASGLAASATKDSQDAKRAAKAQAAEAAASAAAAEPVRAQRPSKTIVTTKVVASASRSGTASVGGGTVRSSSSSTSTRASTKPAVTKPVKVVVPSTGS